jgi:mediator of RNA polymerase II transcription subunit 12
MLATLIHSTLVNDRTETDRNEESRKHTAYHTLVKKLKKEVGENNSVSIRYLRQLLPFPKITLEAIVAEPFGTVSDGKGNKVKGFNVDKKQGLQVSDKQKINPWDILEGHRNPAPLSWSWFRALKHERKPMKYEESFVEL